MYVLPCHGVSHKSKFGMENIYDIRISDNEPGIFLFELGDLLEAGKSSPLPFLTTQRLPQHTSFLSTLTLSETLGL